MKVIHQQLDLTDREETSMTEPSIEDLVPLSNIFHRKEGFEDMKKILKDSRFLHLFCPVVVPYGFVSSFWLAQ